MQILQVFPESPQYLAVTGYKDKAIKAMNRLAKINNSPKPNIEDIDFNVEVGFPMSASDCTRCLWKFHFEYFSNRVW